MKTSKDKLIASKAIPYTEVGVRTSKALVEGPGSVFRELDRWAGD